MEELKVFLKKKGANTLIRTSEGVWLLDGKEVDQEKAIVEMVEATNDLGYWCQVAKDILSPEDFEMVQEAYEYDPKAD